MLVIILTLLVGIFIGSTLATAIMLALVHEELTEKEIEAIQMEAAYNQLQLDLATIPGPIL